VNVVYPTVTAALALVVVTGIRSRETLSWRLVPVRPVALAAVLFTVVGVAGQLGLTRLLTDLLPGGSDPAALFGLGFGSALATNLVDNLPAFFALLPVAADHPARLVAVLVGTNVAPIVTMWASLANILWRQRCARAGLEISRLGFAVRGAILAPVVTAACLAALSWF
jgi:arsenical pump membrane protein